MTAEFAAKVAPEIDRVRVAIAQGVTRSQLTNELGVSPSAGLLLSLFRNLPPDRRTTPEAVKALFPYEPTESTSQKLAELESAAVVDVTDDVIRLTPAGVDAINHLYAGLVEVVDRMWTRVDANFDALAAISEKAIAAAAETGGHTFNVLSPVYERPGAPPAVRFVESLTPLRFHRFDVHVAAWRAAGLTAREIQALDDGPLRATIEADTNRRAAPPYAALDADERTTLLAGLRALPVPLASKSHKRNNSLASTDKRLPYSRWVTREYDTLVAGR